MSTPTPPTEVARGGWRPFLLVWAAVSLVAVLSHFAFAPRMGLYEDDHWLIGVPMCEWASASTVYTEVKGMFARFFQGRPMHYGFGFPLAYLGTHLGGVVGAYVVAAAVWSLNAGLCLALLWKRFGPFVATAGALAFVLLPADTTHPMLHTAFFVHPSVTFLLLSGIAYSRGYRWLAVPLSAVSLITYETAFLPALAWPLLFRDPDRPLWRRCLTHGLLMAVVLGAAAFARMQTGESRVAGTMSDKGAALRKVRELAIVGPKSSFMTFVDRPRWVVKTWRQTAPFSNPGPGRTTTGGVALAAGAAALLALLVARRAGPGVAAADAPPFAGPPVARLVACGLLMVTLSYLIALTRTPEVVDGRMSSVHIGATTGWAVFFGGLAAGVLALLTRLGAPRAAAPVLAAYFCLLAAFHVYVQREYIRAWVAQGEFWRDVAAECPDVQPGTVIIFPLVPATSTAVRHQDWAECMVFHHLFAVPADWSEPPRAYPAGLRAVVRVNYEGYDWNEVERDGDALYWNHWAGMRVRLVPGNVILLHQLPGGRFERITGTMRIHGVDFPLKPREGPAFEFRPHTLYPAMFPNGLTPETRRRVSIGQPR